jgi:phage terminase large subunit GpA-like protein
MAAVAPIQASCHPIGGYAAYLFAAAAGLEPAAPLWVDEWANDHMVIPSESGAAEPGDYRVERTPYARDPMRALSPEHPARTVIIMGASQLLKTQVALNWVCSLIDRAPANIIVLEPTDKLARRVARRFDKTVQAVPILREKVATQASRDEKNTSDTKEFKGGTAWFLSARSASNLAEASARWVVIDEVDRLLREIKGEGDPVSLVRKRQTTYGRKAKTLEISSPTEEDGSKIHEDFLAGDQRKYFVACPHCSEMQPLEWEHLHYDLNEDRAWYVCAANACVIEEHSKPLMLPDRAMGGTAEWRPTATGKTGVWSYTISSLYAPLGWVSWLELAREYDAAEKALANGDGELMRVFYNTRLARVYSPATARIRPAALQAKAEAYPLGIAPAPALMLTATVDVQDNRLEVQIVGWGPGPCGLECWVVNTEILFGVPALPEVWNDLDKLLCTPIRHASGALMIIRAVAIDSGDGDYTQEVYEFCRPRRRRIIGGHRQDVLAIKGASQAKAPIISRGKVMEYTYRGKPAPGGVELFQVGPETAADWFMSRLALEEKIAIHTPAGLPLEFYEQLLAEAKITEWVKGRRVRRYRPLKRGARNEQFDLMKYNVALGHYLGLDRYTAERWAPLEARLRQADLLVEALADQMPAADLPPPAPLPVGAPAPPAAPKTKPARDPDDPATRHKDLVNRLRNRRG